MNMSKVNIVIKVEDFNDPDCSFETKFSDCNAEKILADDSCKLVHGIVKQYLEFLGEEE